MKKNISALFILFVMCFIFVSCTTTTGTLLFSPSYPLQEYEGYGEDDPFLISLKNDTYLRTSELFLLNDETIYLDSEGEVVTGLQMTLKDFGKSIKASGKVNKATFKVLNEVQRAFGLEETDYVDEQVYLDLLPALLIYKDPEAAYDVFWYYGDYGQYEYLNACLLALNGKYWEAYQAFENLDYLDSEERAKACIQKWPNNGVLWKNKSYSSANTELTIAVYASSDSAMFIKLYNGYNYDHVASLFIGGSGKATVSLPSGPYIIKDGVGSLWFGPEDAFGYYGDYETMTFDDGSQIAYFENGYGYTLSINIETATGGKGVGSEYESYEGFVGI